LYRFVDALSRFGFGDTTMQLSWRERLIQQPSLRNMHQWPAVLLDELSSAQQAVYLRNQHIVASVLSNEPYRQIAERFQISVGWISQLMTRCLGGEADQAPPLNRGLVGYENLVDRQRLQPLPSFQQPIGASCAFKALLNQVPRLKEHLDAMIRAKLKDQPNAQLLSPATFHGEFKRVLAEAQWPRDQYPYTTRSCAYESVRRYLYQRINTLQLERAQRKDQRPARPRHVKRTLLRALRAVQIDEHLGDLQSSINLSLDDDLIPVRIARASVLTAVDVDTTCVLGYELCPTKSPNQADLLTLLETCLRPWQALTLQTPGLNYASGACFPNGMTPFFPISFGLVQMDNAFIHRANSVRDFCLQHMGSTMNLGIPGLPEIRDVVENGFKFINTKFSHRVASTTGSSPIDQKRESRKLRKKPPVITYDTINEVLSVILTEYNITPKASLGGVSPLALLQDHCSQHYVRFVPSSLTSQWKPLIGQESCVVHWYPNEHRAPFINFHYRRYDGEGLFDVYLDGSAKRPRVQVTFDRRDIRTLQCTYDGRDLGELRVKGPWQRFPHSLATRDHIHQNTKALRLQARDPLASYFQYFLKHKDHPEKALTLLRLYKEFTGDYRQHLVLGQSNSSPSSERSNRDSEHDWSWSPTMANHRR